MYIDNLVIEDQPAGVVMSSPVPHLKSVDLSWAVSSLGSDFQRYEIYRSTDATVTWDDSLIGSYSSTNDTSMTDSGRSIGATYYYGVYVINTNDTYSSVSTCEATTVPLTLDVIDPMENLDNWDVVGSWGVDSSQQHGGSSSISDSPGTDYQNGENNNYILTAVDLSSATWPVLKFWDRFDITDTAGDWAWAEISPNGTSWSRRYNALGTRTNWVEQSIDLSEWKGEANVRIRFWFQTDSSITGDGWYIDDVSIAEHTPVGLAYPYYEYFEAGISNWLAAGWLVNTNKAYAGANSVFANQSPTLPYGTHLSMTLGDSLDLSTASNPQLTYWLQGSLQNASYYQIQASSDGGKTWGTLDSRQSTWSTNNWTRRQASVSGYTGTNVRFRAAIWSHAIYIPVANMYIDNLVIEDQPDGVALNPLTPHLKSIDLAWTVSGLGAEFKRYEIYRSSDATITWDDTLIGSFTDTNDISMTDTGLSIGVTYHYGVYVVNTNDTYSSPATQSATTVPLVLDVNDPMENLDNWYIQGDWGVDTLFKHGGSASISDSPGSAYQNSLNNNYILTAVNLTSATRPVLSFWDRYDIATAGSDWAWVEISPNGTSWSRRYNCRGTRTNWVEQFIDLSEWNGQENVRIRFWLQTDSSTTRDGWYIDDLAVTDLGAQAMPYPFFENFETDMSNWFNASWALSPDEPYAGDQAVLNTEAPTLPYGTTLDLSPAGAFDLTSSTEPLLTWFVKGSLNSASYYRMQISVNDGLNWTDLDSQNYTWNSGWIKKQVSISAYRTNNVRLRARVWSHSSYNPVAEVYIDNFGLGEPAPGVPTLVSPLHLESVPILRPTLVIQNATDFQSDDLNYEFEVYSDDALSNLVASVPAVAQGSNTTSWTIDSDLPDSSQYWWRCRASDAGTNGPWMGTAIFSVNHVNQPPLPVEVTDPPNDSILRNETYSLSWRPTSDPDIGDTIATYQMQVDESVAFTNPAINDATITIGEVPTGSIWVVSMPLSSFTGWPTLKNDTLYFWRMRACDQWDAWSDWSTNVVWFNYGTHPPTISTMSQTVDGNLTFSWDETGTGIYIDFTPSLLTGAWESAVGPIYGNEVLITPDTDKKTGFYRVRVK